MRRLLWVLGHATAPVLILCLALALGLAWILFGTWDSWWHEGRSTGGLVLAYLLVAVATGWALACGVAVLAAPGRGLVRLLRFLAGLAVLHVAVEAIALAWMARILFSSGAWEAVRGEAAGAGLAFMVCAGAVVALGTLVLVGFLLYRAAHLALPRAVDHRAGVLGAGVLVLVPILFLDAAFLSMWVGRVGPGALPFLLPAAYVVLAVLLLVHRVRAQGTAPVRSNA